jgi:hypothetical protein
MSKAQRERNVIATSPHIHTGSLVNLDINKYSEINVRVVVADEMSNSHQQQMKGGKANKE